MPAQGPQRHLKPGYKQLGAWGWDDQRLWSKIDQISNPDGCHLWQGAMSPSGALMGAWKTHIISKNKTQQLQQMVQARRLVVMSVTGLDVSPYRVTMKCSNQKCCNFSHFELKENNRPDKNV